VRTKKNGLGAASRCLIFERWVVAQASLAEAPRSFLAKGALLIIPVMGWTK
jgi:hypothetical protein